MSRTPKETNIQREAAWLLAVTFVVCVLVGVFRYPIIRWGGDSLGIVFGMFLLMPMVTGMLAIVVSKGWWRKSIATLAMALSVFVIFWSPLEGHYRARDIAENRTAREAVLDDLASGRLAADGHGTFDAPKSAASARCWVIEEDGERWVFFPLQPFGVDNYSGLVHSKTGAPPPRHSFFEVVLAERLDDHWFWISTT